MDNYGFVKVAAASPSLKVADCDFNTDEILKTVADAEQQSVSAIVFPEASITGYTSADLFLQRLLLSQSVVSLERICDASKTLEIIIIIGMPLEIANRLYNAGVVVHKGKILGIVPKTFLPNYSEFYDKRWFSSSRELTRTEISLCGQIVPVGIDLIFETVDFNFALELCEDLWTSIPPSSLHALYGAEVIFNLSASPDTVGKQSYRKALIKQQSARCYAGYVYAAAGNGESTTDLVFTGSSIIAENGEILAEAERFHFDTQLIFADIDIDKLRNERLKNKSFSVSEYKFLDNVTAYRHISIDAHQKQTTLSRRLNPTPFIPQLHELNERCSEIFSIQVGGLAKRLLHTGCKTQVVGVSGGLDSTLALLVMVKVCDKLQISRENIYGITMPGFGTTDRTYNNAIALMKALGVTIREISIADAVVQHFEDIDHNIEVHDITYENSQARERTQILMDYANKVNGLVIGTGDLSELALGWCTYNGDHMSMYAVNTGIPKTLVKTLVKWVSETQLDDDSRRILVDILDTPVSPELLPAKDGQIVQITEDTVGPYILHDFFLYNMLRCNYEPRKIYYLAKYAFKDKYDDREILKWLKTFYRRFFSQQFKRSCIPDGPKVGSINLSPRGDWRMASDSSASLWLQQLDELG
ncbi:MAG: NAD(+) synthase [Dysgonomonas sp.]